MRGRADAPAWERPALIALLGATAVLYLWGLGASGWANTYYSAAVQAGTKSWKAFFFGSLDAGNSITVDKSPGFLWVMELSARIFGVSSWSILVPQALEGVAAVGVLYATVRRWFSPAAALLAGLVLAATPVAALMFRFNNPDALLVLFLVGAAYALTRALEHGSTGWLVFAFSLVGFGFLAKMLQALIVLPAFGLVYLFAGPPRLGRRIGQLFLAGLAMLASAGWWIAVVQLTPAASRPYIGGSQNNSLWNLMFGYNGFGRLTGNENGSVTGGGSSPWGITGLTRLFNADFGGQISWMLPGRACSCCVAGLVFTWKRPRTDRTRAALMLWGGWLVVTVGVVQLREGHHPSLLLGRARPRARRSDRDRRGHALDAPERVRAVRAHRRVRGHRRVVVRPARSDADLASVAARVVGDRRLPGAGRDVVLARARSPRRGRSRSRRGCRRAARPGRLHAGYRRDPAHRRDPVGGPDRGWELRARRSGRAAFGRGGFPRGAFRRGGFGPGGFVPGGAPQGGFNPGGAAPGGFGGFGGLPGGGGRGGGGLGGFLSGTTVNAAMKSLLVTGSTGYRWVAATVDANNAASYQLATGQARDGDRRLQRDRSLTDACAVRTRRRHAQDALLHLGWRRLRRGAGSRQRLDGVARSRRGSRTTSPRRPSAG